MSKKIILFSLIFVILSIGVILPKANAQLSVQGLVEFNLLDLGFPYVGVRIKTPTELELPGRVFNPDDIIFEALYKPGGYLGYTAIQLRGGINFDIGDTFFTQYGAGWVSIGGVSVLTGLIKTGAVLPITDRLNFSAEILLQRTLFGAMAYGLERGWIGINVGVGF